MFSPPNSAKGKIIFPFAEMEYGDSFLIPIQNSTRERCASKRSSVLFAWKVYQNATKDFGSAITTRVESDGLRVWKYKKEVETFTIEKEVEIQNIRAVKNTSNSLYPFDSMVGGDSFFVKSQKPRHAHDAVRHAWTEYVKKNGITGLKLTIRSMPDGVRVWILKT